MRRTAVTSGVDPDDAGAASGLMNTAKQVGGVLGLAALFAIAGPDASTIDTLAAGYARAFLAIAATLILTAAATLTLPRSNATTERAAPGTPSARSR